MERYERSVWQVISRWVLLILVLLAVLFAVIHLLGQQVEVKGSSMYPALADGDRVVVDKILYRFKRPSRYDVVVFPYAYQEDTLYVKRVIGLPGETVQIKDGEVYINGEKLEEHYGTQLIKQPGLAFRAITLSEDEYFVLGDNRNDSSDSREPSVGNIKLESIQGRAVFRVSPIARIGPVR